MADFPMPPAEAGRIAGEWGGMLIGLNNRCADLQAENEELKQKLFGEASPPYEPTEAMIQAGKIARIADFNAHGTTLSPADARRVCKTVWQAMHRAALLRSTDSESKA